MPVKTSLLLLILLCGIGCTHRQTPNVFPVFDQIKQFTSANSIHLVNGQPSTADMTIYSAGIHKHVANYNKWTDVAIALTTRELTRRGMRVIPNADRTLTLVIKNANIDAGWARIDTHVYLTATTSGGYSATYDGFDFAVMAGSIQGQIDTALMKSVAAMLNDPKIVDFLTN